MALSVRCLFLAGLVVGGALGVPVDESSSNSETQVPSLQSIVLPASTKPIPTQALVNQPPDEAEGIDDDLDDSNDVIGGSSDVTTSYILASAESPPPKFLTVPVASKQVQKRQKDEEKTPDTAKPKPKKVLRGEVRLRDESYVVYDSDDIPCIMAYFKAKITVSYPVDLKNKKYERLIVRPPAYKVNVTGTCDRGSQQASMNLQWKDGTMTLKFAFDTLTDSWYVGEFSFMFDTSSPRFKGAETKELVIVKSDKNKRFWTTSHARSFRCLLLHDVIMKDKKDQYSGIIHFDEARVQALTKTDTYKTPKHCIHRVHRDEMVPLAVGGSLAASVIVTIAGYAIFRYIKVKKFQYNTME